MKNLYIVMSHAAWYMYGTCYGTCFQNIYHGWKPLYIGLSAWLWYMGTPLVSAALKLTGEGINDDLPSLFISNTLNYMMFDTIVRKDKGFVYTVCKYKPSVHWCPWNWILSSDPVGIQTQDLQNRNLSANSLEIPCVYRLLRLSSKTHLRRFCADSAC